MKKIPKFVVQNIEQITRYAEKMEHLITGVEKWYERNMRAYKDVDVPDEELNYISSNERGLREFSLRNIEENFRILDEAKKRNKKH